MPNSNGLATNKLVQIWWRSVETKWRVKKTHRPLRRRGQVAATAWHRLTKTAAQGHDAKIANLCRSGLLAAFRFARWSTAECRATPRLYEMRQKNFPTHLKTDDLIVYFV
jgi:hypothetical protein